MASDASFRLIIRKGPQPNQVYELTKDVMTLGRDITNDIVVNDPEVSRHHSRLTKVAGGYAVEDLGSTNGTLINHRQTTGQQALADGDLLGVGETVTLAYEATGVPVLGTDATIGVPPPSAMPPSPEPATMRPRGRATEQATGEDGGTGGMLGLGNLNRKVVIGCAVVLALGCCVVTAAVIVVLSDVLCQTPIGLCII